MDLAGPTRFHRVGPFFQDSAIGSFNASNSSSISFTAESPLTISHASISRFSLWESFSARAAATYLDRSRAGTRLVKLVARSAGIVKVIFRTAILAYYHI